MLKAPKIHSPNDKVNTSKVKVPIRLDRMGNKIINGDKKHKISFRDKV